MNEKKSGFRQLTQNSDFALQENQRQADFEAQELELHNSYLAEKKARRSEDNIYAKNSLAEKEAYEENARFDAERSAETLKQAINRRSLSDEVRGYNDRAHLDIFGSGKSTFVDKDGHVIASPASPREGVIDQIKSDPNYGKSASETAVGRTTKERQEKAQNYLSQVEKLLSQGYELSQAKLIMDLRQQNIKEALNILADKISNDKDPNQSKEEVRHTFLRLHQKQLDLIKYGGAFSESDYKRLLKGEKLYDDKGNYIDLGSTPPKTNDSTTINAKSETPASGSEDSTTKNEDDNNNDESSQTQEPTDDLETTGTFPAGSALTPLLEAQQYTLEEALAEAYEMNESEFAQLSVVHERSAFRSARNPRGNRSASRIAPGQIVTEQMVEESRQSLEEIRRNNHSAMRQRLEAAGADALTINAIMRSHDETFAREINFQTAQEKLRLSGLSGEGALATTRLKFYDWWARQGGGGDRFFSRHRLVGTAKKAAVMGLIGVPAGILGTFMAPAIGGVGGIVGAAMSARVAGGVMRGLASAHIAKNADMVGPLQNRRRIEDQYASIGAVYDDGENAHQGPESVTDQLMAGTDREVARNKRRVVFSIGSVALGAGFAAGLSAIGDHLLSSGGSGNAIHHAFHSATAKKPASVVPASAKPVVTQVPKSSTHVVKAPKVSHLTTKTTAEIIPGPNTVNVASGDGIINEISNYASRHNKHISDARAYAIYEQLFKNHGRDIIRMNGSGTSSYVIRPGDIGIARPGIGHWDPGVQAELDKLLAA